VPVPTLLVPTPGDVGWVDDVVPVPTLEGAIGVMPVPTLREGE
jgi:hypothetical protein